MTFLIDNWEKVAGFIITLFGIILPIWQYFNSKRLEEEDKRFQNYHKLIDDLVGGNGRTPMLERQIVILFELRNFKKYYPVTLRLLQGLKITWEEKESKNIPFSNKPKLDETDSTIKFIEKKQKGIFSFCKK